MTYLLLPLLRTCHRLLLALLLSASTAVSINAAPLKLELTDGVIEPLPYALAPFLPRTASDATTADVLAQVVAQDLGNTGLFRRIAQSAFIGQISSFDSPIQFADWRAINAQALITGEVESSAFGKITVRFRLFDVFSGQEVGTGLQFSADRNDLRRLGHKIADQIYSRITGEAGYFDSRIVFINETGPKNARVKQLAIADYDGQNPQVLTNGAALVLSPRVSPDGKSVLYTSFATGRAQLVLRDLRSGRETTLRTPQGFMSFAPRFSPDGRQIVYSLETGGNTDIYTMPVSGGSSTRLTSAPSIETAPSFSPDGSQIVFESDRSGTQQLYIMPAAGGAPKRISFGTGRYGTPVWSPRGDLIAFTKQSKGRFHIGVMRTDGSEERLLTASFLDEGPTWAPNGRVIMFTRQTQGARGMASLYSVDISGRNLSRVITPDGASDPSWSPLLP